jgi:hypothetical protein
MPLVGALYNEDGFQGEYEFPRQVKLPCQNANHLDRQNHYYGNELVKPPINGEFDDFGGKRKDYTNNVWGINSQWSTNGSEPLQQLENSEEESRYNTGTQMVRSECSNRTRVLSLQLGKLLRINSLEGSARAEEKQCHLVLPNDRPTIWKNKDDASVCQVSASDEIDEVHGYRNNLPIRVETIMNSNRRNIANSLGFKLHNEDQKDYISYIKEEFIGYIEEVKEYGFDHIIIIGEPYYGMLFLDCFGRVFNLDSMTNTLFFLGDYFKRVEKMTKGLETGWVPWILDSDKGKIVEANGICKMCSF